MQSRQEGMRVEWHQRSATAAGSHATAGPQPSLTHTPRARSSTPDGHPRSMLRSIRQAGTYAAGVHGVTRDRGAGGVTQQKASRAHPGS